MNGMLRHVNGHGFRSAVLKCLLAGQLKLSVGGQCLFDPMDGTADGTFGATVINADVFHSAVFAVVLQGDEEFVTDGEVWRFSSVLRAVFRRRLAKHTSFFGRPAWLFRCCV